MDGPLADGAPVGTAWQVVNLTIPPSWHAVQKPALGGAGLLGGAEKLACRSKENSPPRRVVPQSKGWAPLVPRHCLPLRRSDLRAEWPEPPRGLALPPARPPTARRSSWTAGQVGAMSPEAYDEM